MKIIWKIFSIFIIMLFVNCGNGEEDKVVVTFWHAMGGPLGKTLDSLIMEFNNEHPAIEIKPVGMGNYQALSQKLMATVAAEKPPTISQLYESWTDQFVKADVLISVEDLLDSTVGDKLKKDIYKVFIEDNTWNGKSVTLPLHKSVPAYFYNRTIFKKKGIDHFPETWGEYIEVGEKLTEDTNGDGKPDFWATAFPMGTWIFETLLYQQGGKLLSEDDHACLFNEKEGVEALNILIDILHRYKIGYLTTGYQHQDDFLSGKVAFVSGSVVSFSYISANELDFALTEPKIAKWMAGRQILGREGIEPALRGVKTPEEALDESATRINKILRGE